MDIDNPPTIHDELRQPSNREATVQGEREAVWNFWKQLSRNAEGKQLEPIADDKAKVSLTKQNKLEVPPTPLQLQKAEDAVATTKSHLTASVNIEISSPPIFEQPSPRVASEQKYADDFTPQKVAVAAVEQVLLEVNETIIKEFNPHNDDKDLLAQKTNSEDKEDAEHLAINKASILDKDNSDSSINKNFLNTHDIASMTSQGAKVDEEEPLLQPSIFFDTGTSKTEKSQAEKSSRKYVFCFR